MSNSPARILVVEDEASTALLLRFILREVGLKVTVAGDGEQGWERAQSESFDLVIADQQMPNLTGAELLARLRETPEYATTPFVMATAKGFELDIPLLEEQLQLAAVFVKPFSPKKVAATVERLLAACE
jgi:CheY-like chemotaxis protein